jgi:3-oxoacyl-[acyl-carrier-protein] synthase III
MLQYQSVCLEGFGYSLPEHVVTSSEIERELADVYARFGLHEGRLELMTGIRERRFWDDDSVPSDGSTRAGRHALERTDTRPQEIECLIHGSVSRDFLEPATASVVHDNLRLPRESMLYDISNACLGFLNGMISLANMIELGQIRKGLVVAGESSRSLVHTTIAQLRRATRLTRRELKSAFASLTIGSGAVAAVMSHVSVSKSRHRIIGGVVRSSTEHNHLCRGSADTGFSGDASMSMNTDSETLLVHGCELARSTWVDFVQATGWPADTLARTYCHQVGSAHRDRFYQAIGLDARKDYSTFEFLGNVGSVSLPLTMALGVERDPPVKQDRIAMLGIGSGLSCIMLGVEW